MKIQNPIFVIFSKIKEINRRHWKFIIKEVSLAKSNPKGSGIAFFIQILDDISIFSFQKRKYVKEHLKKFKESFDETR